MQWPLKKNSGNGCGNEEYGSHLKQEIIYILCFTEINSTNSYWCKGVNLVSKITYIPRKELLAKLTSFWSGAELLLLIQWFAIHLWERSAEQFIFKECLLCYVMTFSIRNSRKTRRLWQSWGTRNSCQYLWRIVFNLETNKQAQI